MPCAVSHLYLTEAILDLYTLPIRRRGHIAVGERISQEPVGRSDLLRQGADQTAVTSFVDRARVVRDQTAQHSVCALDVPQEACAIERVEAGDDQIRCVACLFF